METNPYHRPARLAGGCPLNPIRLWRFVARKLRALYFVLRLIIRLLVGALLARLSRRLHEQRAAVAALVDWARWLTERSRIYRRRGVRLGKSWVVLAIYASPFHPSAAALRRVVDLADSIPPDELQPVLDRMEAVARERRKQGRWQR